MLMDEENFLEPELPPDFSLDVFDTFAWLWDVRKQHIASWSKETAERLS